MVYYGGMECVINGTDVRMQCNTKSNTIWPLEVIFIHYI